jgi:hypothetical protein
MVNITYVDVLSLAASIPYANQLASIANASTDHVSFISYHDSFANDILGPNASQELVTQEPWVAFHEAGVYNHPTGISRSSLSLENAPLTPSTVTRQAVRYKQLGRQLLQPRQCHSHRHQSRQRNQQSSLRQLGRSERRCSVLSCWLASVE